ncbi:hypothetical protein HJG54_25110 [Leptolyngbya sp. NK1-12]|uniref:Uncharacterized protein n=1 Tax=Leptolyngbya sp. NK1-12 TaxID=2547451 RepID=A0AA96WJF8_9CYAN|nr:hypothetical protein [Leptolyngbya sp. NK1-12]WNZ25790.1 hypothetical protein HJG54_25110 [Leptolyngbya sp. NK1-12]
MGRAIACNELFDQRPVILLEDKQAFWQMTHEYVENVAASIALAITNDRATGRIYNLGEATTPTLLQRIQLLGRIVGWDGEVVRLPTEKLPAHLQMNLQWQYHFATDTGQIREELGYVEPISVEEALRRTIAWEKDNLLDSNRTELLEQYHAEAAVMTQSSTGE